MVCSAADNGWLNIFAGVIHLFGVITSLWTFGKYLERVVLLPGLTVPLLYLVSGIAGAITSASLAYDLDSAGASAGVCGLLGKALLLVLAGYTEDRA